MTPPRPKLITPGRLAAASVQFAIFAGLLWLGHAGARMVAASLDGRGLPSGFGFLGAPAGVGISQTLIALDSGSTYGRLLLAAVGNTLLAAGLSILVAMVLGLVIGLARLSSNWLVAGLAGAYVQVLGHIPVLVQLLFWYVAVLPQLPGASDSLVIAGAVLLNEGGLFVPGMSVGNRSALALAGGCVLLGALARVTPGLDRHGRRALGAGLIVGGLALVPAGLAWHPPRLAGGGMVEGAAVLDGDGVRLMPELVALVLALGLAGAAEIAGIVRAGFGAVPRGQIDAARAIGLSTIDSVRFIVLPQMGMHVAAPLVGACLTLTRDTAIGVAIAYPDLAGVLIGTVLARTGHAVEILAILTAAYLTASLVAAGLAGWFTMRHARHGEARA